MEPPQTLSDLRNSYYALRHGRSAANEEGRIVSGPAEGLLPRYGLTAEGRAQVLNAVRAAAEKGWLGSDAVIASSDFARARESAEIARDILGSAPVVLTPKLRERYFGRWDGGSDSNYARVWEADLLDSEHAHDGVESAASVLHRALSLVAEIEAVYAGTSVLLVSHGDVLQILQTAFEGIEAGKHRLLEPLGTGQIRPLVPRQAARP